MPRSIVIPALFLSLVFPGAVTHAQGQPSREAGLSFHVERRTGGLRTLQETYSGEQILILQKLNRRDLAHLVRDDSIIVPDAWRSGELAYSPFPAFYAWAARYPKVLVIHHPGQAFAGYENGRLVRWGPVSSGRKSRPTPSGLFHLNWKVKGRHSTVDADWYMPWYFNFENRLGLSLHEYIFPGYPASHACERLLKPDAVWLYGWGEQWTLDERRVTVLTPGTPLLIIGQYAFGSPPPWMSPAWAEHGIDLPENPVLERSDR